jgi:RNA polymerase sigma-70 factor (ECF subfamily)
MSLGFQETRWSLVQEAKGGTEAARAALADLCAAYYAPVFAFTRAWCEREDMARDLAHGFFETLLGGASINGADPARGQFRSFLLGAARHYLTAQAERRRAGKRGGGAAHCSIEAAADLPDSTALPPDALFDRHWACALLERTLERLRREQEDAGRSQHWEALNPWLSAQAAHGDTAVAAKRLGLSDTAVRVHLHRLRKRWRELLRSEIAQTLTAAEDPDQELRYLLGALR